MAIFHSFLMLFVCLPEGTWLEVRHFALSPLTSKREPTRRWDDVFRKKHDLEIRCVYITYMHYIYIYIYVIIYM